MKIMQTLTSPKSILPFITPFVVYMICTSLEPSPETSLLDPKGLNIIPFPWFYAGKLLLTLLAIAFCFPAWREWLRRPSRYGILAGIIGAVVWIGLCQMEQRSVPDFLPGMGLEQIFPTTRDGYNWLSGENCKDTNSSSELRVASCEKMLSHESATDLVPTNQEERSANSHNSQLATRNSTNILHYSGYLVRLFGLVLVVPLIEELFLRGFVLRYFWKAPQKEENDDIESVKKENDVVDSRNTQLATSNSEDAPAEWYDVPFGSVCPMVWAISALYPVLTHPEALAGIVWFSGMTFLAWKTKSLSDCICAHAITNLALGLWVAYSGQWYLM